MSQGTLGRVASPTESLLHILLVMRHFSYHFSKNVLKQMWAWVTCRWLVLQVFSQSMVLRPCLHGSTTWSFEYKLMLGLQTSDFRTSGEEASGVCIINLLKSSPWSFWCVQKLGLSPFLPSIVPQQQQYQHHLWAWEQHKISDFTLDLSTESQPAL